MRTMELKRLLYCLLILSFVISGYQKSVIKANYQATYSLAQITGVTYSGKQLLNPLPNDIGLNEEFGEQRVFWVLDFSNRQYVQKNATLLSVGEKCYVYMTNDTINTIGQSTAIARCTSFRNEFDTVIYDKDVEFIGHPDGRLGDVDGDPKITILFAPLGGVGGYYLDKDEYSGIAYSNEREMIYISSSFAASLGSFMTIIHEFNHLIWFNYEQDEGHLLLEGAAECSIYYGGYLSYSNAITQNSGLNLTYHSISFKTEHQQSLLSFHLDDGYPLGADYGKSYMFVFYLMEKFGVEFIRTLVSTIPDGPLGIDTALTELGYDNISFNEIFLNWITACSIDQENFQDGLFGFKNADFVVSPDTTITDYSFAEQNVKHYPYGFHVKKLINPPNEFTFKITNPYPSYSLGVSVAIHDQNGWTITQTVHSENREVIGEHLSGEQIDEVYLITAIMSEHTPETFVDFINIGEEPYYVLDYSIEEGHGQITGAIKNSIGFTLGFIVMISCTRLLLSKFQKKKNV